MPRQYRYLPAIKSTRVPSNFIFVTVETKSTSIANCDSAALKTLKRGVALAVRTRADCEDTVLSCEFNTDARFWALVKSRLSPRRPLWVVSHDASTTMSALRLWKQIEAGSIKWRFVCLDEGAWIVKAKAFGCTLWIVDLCNYLRETMEDLRESFGRTGDQDRPGGVECGHPHKDAYRDVETIKSAFVELTRVVKDLRTGCFRPTASGLAFCAFRTMMPAKQLLVHRSEDVLEMEREGYYSGLNIPFFVGHACDPQKGLPVEYEHGASHGWPVHGGPVTVLDVNSMYGHVMREYKYPSRLIGVATNPPVSWTERAMARMIGCARVNIVSDSDLYPVRHGKRTYHACGKFTTTLCGEDLMHALNGGHVSKIHKIAYYQAEPIFGDYVDRFWTLRSKAIDDGDKVHTQLWKLFLNGLYGKFGQRGDTWIDFPCLDWERTWGESVCMVRGEEGPQRLRWIGSKCQRLVERPNGSLSMPIVSACVTAAARRYLLRLIEAAGERHVLYCDTDSLHCDPVGVRNLHSAGHLDDRALGRLKVEGIYQHAYYRGVKDYWVDGQPVIAGLKKDAIIMDNGVVEYEEAEHNAGVPSRPPSDGVIVRRLKKKMNAAYLPGRLRSDGWLEPYAFDGVVDPL